MNLTFVKTLTADECFDAIQAIQKRSKALIEADPYEYLVFRIWKGQKQYYCLGEHLGVSGEAFYPAPHSAIYRFGMKRKAEFYANHFTAKILGSAFNVVPHLKGEPSASSIVNREAL
jgi:hypothetical protein